MVEPIGIKDIPSLVTMQNEKQNEEIHENIGDPSKGSVETPFVTIPAITPLDPPYTERLVLKKTIEKPYFDILGELKNLYVKIPLLQAIHDVPIYTKAVRDLCVKKHGRKSKDPLTVHVVGKLSELMLGKVPPIKYGDPGNPTVTINIG